MVVLNQPPVVVRYPPCLILRRRRMRLLANPFAAWRAYCADIYKRQLSHSPPTCKGHISSRYTKPASSARLVS